MNRFRVWGLSAALVASTCLPALADPPTMPGEQTTLVAKISQMFGPKPPKPVGPAAQAGPRTITAPLSPEVRADAFRAEVEAQLRRMMVCTELHRVADEQGDATLARQADDLERQVIALYNARVAALGIKTPPLASPLASPEPAPVKAAANRLSAPPSPVPGTNTAQVREVQP